MPHFDWFPIDFDISGLLVDDDPCDGVLVPVLVGHQPEHPEDVGPGHHQVALPPPVKVRLHGVLHTRGRVGRPVPNKAESKLNYL